MEPFSILGGLFGGIFRLVPEFMKLWDRKNEREHELAMSQQQMELIKLQGNFRMAEVNTQSDIEHMNAIMEVAKAQAQLTGVKWVDAWNSLMRPLITTQWLLILYPAVLIASYILTVQSGTPPLDALVNCFGPDEKAICSGLFTFWFLDRVIRKDPSA
jgi:hypothetical protein